MSGGECNEEPSLEGLKTVLDNLDALVYVSDFETYDLLYVNSYGRRIWGAVAGKKCWQALQDESGPCSFCTNQLLVDDKGEATAPFIWEFQNAKNKRCYQCRDQAIRWTDGRLVRLEIATDITDLKNAELALVKANEQAKSAAFEDDLTRLQNRRSFFEFGNQAIKQALRKELPLSVIMLDLDHFKAINDNFGHSAGDTLLREIGRVLKCGIRESDIAARIGGEEFALVLPDTPLREAKTMAERILMSIRNANACHEGHSLSITASLGVSARRSNERNIETILSRADSAMYEAKSAGRDRIRSKS